MKSLSLPPWSQPKINTGGTPLLLPLPLHRSTMSQLQKADPNKQQWEESVRVSFICRLTLAKQPIVTIGIPDCLRDLPWRQPLRPHGTAMLDRKMFYKGNLGTDSLSLAIDEAIVWQRMQGKVLMLHSHCVSDTIL